MSRELTFDERRRAIDSRLETVLESARGDHLEPARTSIVDRDDRWYGQLVVLVYNSVAETPDETSVLHAATAMELLHGYCRLRMQLLGRLRETAADPVAWESDTALLASDYLYTAAYSTLGGIETADVETCFATLASVSETILETFGSDDVQPSPTAYCSFVDGTAGALGRGAAVIGATLATVEDQRRHHVATLGREFSAARRIQHTLAADTDVIRTVAPIRDERQLRQCAQRRLVTAYRALEALSSTTDVASLRTFVEASLSSASANTVLE